MPNNPRVFISYARSDGEEFAVQFMALIMTPGARQSAMVHKDWRAARERGKRI